MTRTLRIYCLHSGASRVPVDCGPRAGVTDAPRTCLSYTGSLCLLNAFREAPFLPPPLATAGSFSLSLGRVVVLLGPHLGVAQAGSPCLPQDPFSLKEVVLSGSAAGRGHVLLKVLSSNPS